jgi:protein associated with RNAse G/E
VSNPAEQLCVSEKLFTINSRKFGGELHRTWQAKLLEETDELLIFVGEFGFDVEHPKLGKIRKGTISYEYYWRDKWFNVFRFQEPDGAFRNFYCNINQPPILSDGVLDYIDLEIDIVVWKDFRYEILDREEFEENARRNNFSSDFRAQIDASLRELIEKIEKREFPFDLEIVK